MPPIIEEKKEEVPAPPPAAEEKEPENEQPEEKKPLTIEDIIVEHVSYNNKSQCYRPNTSTNFKKSGSSCLIR